MPVRLPRGQVILLAVLLVALAAIAAYQFLGGTGGTPAATGPRRPAAQANAVAGGQGLPPVPDLKLEDLTARRPEPEGTGRNLFREKPKAPPAPPPRVVQAPAKPDPNAPPPPPPPPPPITLKFIGVVQAKGGTVAVFSDGRDVFYGREGELIEGRYRIIRIGVESVELSYADGRGRQRIPLTG